MKKTCGILFVVTFVSFLVGSLFAQEMMKEDEDVQMMMPMMSGQGSMGMMGQMPMMEGMMMGKDDMMMGHGGMMCPMCGNMMPMMGMMHMEMMEQVADKLREKG